jgi:formylmethanofuran dehydrogenase subunit E
MLSKIENFPDDLKQCIAFHGHLCPGLIYGYRVAKEACRALETGRSGDEEIVAVAENDSCAVDALQVILGTTLGKGNLIIRDYGKNAFTIADRKSGRALRFSRTKEYRYGGDRPEEFERLEAKLNGNEITEEERKRQRLLKSLDLLTRDFKEIFYTEEMPSADWDYAPVEKSLLCSVCGEMTMASRLVKRGGKLCCIPCTNKP